MRSRLGALLVRAGLLTPAQHLQAVEQSEDGDQPLIASILGLGYVSEDRLVELFREQLLVPVVTPEMLLGPPAEALAAVPAQMAREFLLCPCGIDAQGSLMVAMADASDTHALDEVTFHSGRRVVRFVATERAVRWAIGRYYGLDLGQPTPPWTTPPSEEIVLLTKVKVPGSPARAPVARTPSQTLAGPVSLLMAPQTPTSSPQATGRSPSSEQTGADSSIQDQEVADSWGGRKRRGTLLGVPTRDIQRITNPTAYSDTRDTPDGVPTPDGKVAGTLASKALPFQARDPAGVGPAGAAGMWSSGETLTDRGVPSEALGQALASLRRAQQLDDVGRALLHYFEAFFLDVFFLVVRQQRLVGWRGGGIRLHPDRVPGLDVSLSEPSTLREAVSSRLVYQGPLGRFPQDAVFGAQLGYEPGTLLLVPIQFNKQVIGLLCADSPHTRLIPGEVDLLLDEADRAYESVRSQ